MLSFLFNQAQAFFPREAGFLILPPRKKGDAATPKRKPRVFLKDAGQAMLPQGRIAAANMIHGVRGDKRKR